MAPRWSPTPSSSARATPPHCRPRGFRDAIEIGRESRYDLNIELPKPLVPRSLRFDAPERTLADGTTHEALDTAFVERLARERAARAAVLHAAPHMRVSLSSDVSPSIREFERTSTTIANVYVQARVEKYLRGLQQCLRALQFGGNLFLMLSMGGIATVETAAAFPIRLLESGPAAGALAAAVYGLASGHPNLVSFDMGGTTAKFCVIEDGKPLIAHEFEFDRIYRFRKGSGLPATISVIELVEIGAGGGSIARVNSLGLLKVGPDSSGSDPGPVCYAREPPSPPSPTPTPTSSSATSTPPSSSAARWRSRSTPRAPPSATVSPRRSASPSTRRPGASTPSSTRPWPVPPAPTSSSAAKTPHTLPMFAFGGAGPMHG